MAKKFLDNTGLSHLIDLIQGMPDDQTIGYTTEAGLHVLDGGITPDKISSLQQLRYEMGLGNTLGALPIENGGTGATNAEGAIENLGLEEYILNLINTSGSGGEMKPYLMMSVAHNSRYNDFSNFPTFIDGYGFAGSFACFTTSGDSSYTNCFITCSVPGTYIISSTNTDWDETWNVSSVPATKTLKCNSLLTNFAVSIYPA